MHVLITIFTEIRKGEETKFPRLTPLWERAIEIEVPERAKYIRLQRSF
jgi:hypothetical protein